MHGETLKYVPTDWQHTYVHSK